MTRLLGMERQELPEAVESALWKLWGEVEWDVVWQMWDVVNQKVQEEPE